MTAKNPAAAFGSAQRRRDQKGLRTFIGKSGTVAKKRKEKRAKLQAVEYGAKKYAELAEKQRQGKKLTTVQLKALAKHEASFLRTHGLEGTDRQIMRTQDKLRKEVEASERKRAAAIGRILGPSGEAQAVKIAKATGEPFTAEDVAGWRGAGWQVEAAGTVAARPGAGGLAGTVLRQDDFSFQNPDPLGAGGLARAIVLIGPVDKNLLLDLVADGYDVAPAPKKLREPLRNPAPSQKKVYAALVAATKKRHALRVDELAEKIKAPLSAVSDALAELLGVGLAHEAGRDLFGPCYAAGTPARSLFDNPEPGVKARKKAAAWYQKKNLETGSRTINLPDTVEAVEVGRIVSITYESDKYDGRKRLWKHDVTGNRTLHISTDGKVLVVLPGFKVTKRGIEG